MWVVTAYFVEPCKSGIIYRDMGIYRDVSKILQLPMVCMHSIITVPHSNNDGNKLEFSSPFQYYFLDRTHLDCPN